MSFAYAKDTKFMGFKNNHNQLQKVRRVIKNYLLYGLFGIK